MLTADDVPDFGPKMSALPPKRRALVMALFDEDAPRKGDGLLAFAAQRAGYGSSTSSAKSLGVIAGRIVHDDQVQEAIAEHSHRVMRTIPPEAIRALKDLIRDSKHPQHFKAIAAVIDRTDPLQTLHTVTVQDNRPPTPEAIELVLKKINELARRAGLSLPAPIAAVDAEFVVVEPGA
jgi:hypothetical protein